MSPEEQNVSEQNVSEQNILKQLQKFREQNERGKVYGSPKVNGQAINIVNTILTSLIPKGSKLNQNECKYFIYMMVTKLVRIMSCPDGNHQDSYLDLINYSAFLADAKVQTLPTGDKDNG